MGRAPGVKVADEREPSGPGGCDRTMKRLTSIPASWCARSALMTTDRIIVGPRADWQVTRISGKLVAMAPRGNGLCADADGWSAGGVDGFSRCSSPERQVSYPRPMDRCLQDDTLLQLLAGSLSAEAAAAVRAHLSRCSDCLRLLAALNGNDISNASSSTPDSAIPGSEPALPEFIDEYRVLRPIGQGAMGQVLLGHDTLLDRPVAIKLLGVRPQEEGARERTLLEGRAIARLHHPNVVAIYRVGSMISDGRPYLVSEFVRGQSMEKLDKPLPWRQVLRIGIELSRGLAAAHRSGVLHRDIKPANAILAEGGEAKLLDFGLAKLLSEGRSSSPEAGVPEASLPEEGLHFTRTGTVIGTPLYMSPEAWRGEAATPRSDVYSLGALLYELLTGRPPHQGRSLQDLARAVQERAPAPIAAIVKGVDPRMSRVLQRCLCFDAAQRPASGGELCRALEDLLRRRSVRVLGSALTAAVLILGGAGLLLSRRQAPGGALLPAPTLRLTYQIHEEQALSREIDRLAGDVEEVLLGQIGVLGGVERADTGEGARLRIAFPDGSNGESILARFQQEFGTRLRVVQRGADEWLLALQEPHAEGVRRWAIQHDMDVLSLRLHRLGVENAHVRHEGGLITVALPTPSAAVLTRTRRLLGREARLDLKLVHSDSAYMHRLASFARTHTTVPSGLVVGLDTWRSRATGVLHIDPFLRARERSVLDGFLARLPADLAIPSTHEIRFEQGDPRGMGDDWLRWGAGVASCAVASTAGVEQPLPVVLGAPDLEWRSFYLSRRAVLTSEDLLTDAEEHMFQGRPEVTVTYRIDSSLRFARLSGGHVGWRLALLLDDQVISAPVIEGEISAGRVRVSLGSHIDPAQLRQEVGDLLLLLRTGALAAPLTLLREDAN